MIRCIANAISRDKFLSQNSDMELCMPSATVKASRAMKDNLTYLLALACACLVGSATLAYAAPVTVVPTKSTYSSRTANVNGLQMTIWTKPVNNGGATRIASANGRVWFAEHDTGKLVSFPANGIADLYSIPSLGIDVRAVTSGDNEGSIWFAGFNRNIVGSVSGKGVFNLYSVGSVNTGSMGMSTDLIGNLWLATSAHGILRFGISTGVKFFSIVDNADQPTTVTLGGDGAMWFVEKAGSNVGKIGFWGKVTEYPAEFAGLSNSYGITTGPDGNIWFCDPARRRIGRMGLDGKGLTYFKTGLTGTPVSIVTGPDNQMYFGEEEGRIGRISVSGVIKEFGIPGAEGTANFPVKGLTVGPGGNIWFVNDKSSQVGMLRLATAATDCVKAVWRSLVACGWPGLGNTGHDAGTVLKSTPSRTITVDGTIISGEKIVGGLVIAAKNVTVKNSWIIESAGGVNASGVIKIEPGASATLLNNTLDGSNATHAGIWYEGVNLIARRNHIVGVNDGIFVWDADNFTIADNYLHQFTTAAGNGHIDGFQTEGASHGIIRHNVFDISQEQNAAVAIWNGRRDSDDIVVDNNLMAGSGFAVYAQDYSPSEANPAGGFSVTNIRFLNNMFSTARFPCVGNWGVWYPRGAPTDRWRRRGNRVLETWESIDTRNPSVDGFECR